MPDRIAMSCVYVRRNVIVAWVNGMVDALLAYGYASLIAGCTVSLKLSLLSNVPFVLRFIQ